MGHVTVRNVPTISNYDVAKRVHDRIVPLRGRNPEVRPLGKRRDADTYSIRCNAEGDVECVLYQTPVVTFKRDGSVLINRDGWHTASTNQFIGQVLGFPAYNRTGHMIIAPNRREEEYAIAGDKVTLRPSQDKSSRWVVELHEKLYTYKMDKQKANSVMAKYKEFNGYFRNMIALRKEHSEAESIVLASNEYSVMEIRSKSDNELQAKFMELVQEDTDGTFYEAFLLLGLATVQSAWVRYRLLGEVTAGEFKHSAAITAMRSTLRKMIMKHHAKEVLYKEELPQGKTPNPKYVGWIKG